MSALTTAEDQGITLPGKVSYAKIFRIPHRSTREADYFWAICRVRISGDGQVTTGWMISEFEVRQIDGVVSWNESRGRGPRFLITSGNRLGYLSCAEDYVDGELILRCGFGFNPAAGHDWSWISYFEICTRSGELTGDGLRGRSVNIYDKRMPLRESELERVVNPVSRDMRRRFFGVAAGPMEPALAYADWSIGSESSARYSISQRDAGKTWRSTDIGVAGSRIGYTAEANYLPGMAFQGYPRTSSAVFAVSRVDGRSRLVRYVPEGSEVVTTEIISSEIPLARPVCPRFARPGEVLVSQISEYGSGNSGGFTRFSAKTLLVNAEA